MYKCKLQELCQHKQWALPKYSCVKDGPDHIPRFKAHVFVNGVPFGSPTPCNSSKEAHNEAAKLAFLHFTAAPSSEDASDIDLMSLSLDGSRGDSSAFYKNLLQELAQKEGFCLPTYKSIRTGAPHTPIFYSTVEVEGEGETFHGKAAKTKKLAELDAAKVAYTVFKERRLRRSGKCNSPGSPVNEASKFIPNMDRMTPPEQNLNSGSFLVSSPTIECKEHAKENEDAKVVSARNATSNAKAGSQEFIPSPSSIDIDNLTGYKRRFSIESVLSSAKEGSPFSSANGDSKPMPNLDKMTPVVPEKSLNSRGLLVSSPTIKFKEHANESEDVKIASAENLTASAKISSQDFIPSSVNTENLTEDEETSIQSVPFSSIEGSPSSPTFTPPDLSALSIADTNMAKASGTESYLLCNRVRVYPCIPDTSFPEGITWLPISDDKWVAASLDFPNEKGI